MFADPVLVGRRLVTRWRQPAAVHRLHPVADRRRRRYGDAAVVRLLDARGGVVRVRSASPSARGDLLVSFSLVMIFCLSMIFLSTQINWQGQILDEGPRLCLLLADRIGAEIGSVGRAGVPDRLLGRGVLVGARRLARRAVSVRRLAASVAAHRRRQDSRAARIAAGRRI